MELRCDSKLHGILVGRDIVEFKCDSRFCGAAPGIVVLHRFSVGDGHLIETKLFKDTPVVRKENQNALGHGSAVRSA